MFLIVRISCNPQNRYVPDSNVKCIRESNLACYYLILTLIIKITNFQQFPIVKNVTFIHFNNILPILQNFKYLFSRFFKIPPNHLLVFTNPFSTHSLSSFFILCLLNLIKIQVNLFQRQSFQNYILTVLPSSKIISRRQV